MVRRVERLKPTRKYVYFRQNPAGGIINMLGITVKMEKQKKGSNLRLTVVPMIPFFLEFSGFLFGMIE